jgi:CBS domain containing-hemolysin-like protein
LIASKPLTAFVNAHPTVVVLCLGFLLMIGFSLVAEGFGFKVPKGYLYAAIGFSVLIELLNQLARHNGIKTEAGRPMRERTAEAVLRMLGKRLPDEVLMPAPSLQAGAPAVSFGIEERNMVSGVLTLAERSVHSVMTPRTEISWINLDDSPQDIQQQIAAVPHSFFPVCRVSVDDVVGIGRAKDMIADLLTHGNIRKANLREPIIVHDTISIIRLMDTLKRSRGQLVLVADEFGTIQGLVTPIDVFEAIAGEFPDEDETPDIVSDGADQWSIDGGADLHHLEQLLDTEGLVDADQDYTTLAGYLLERFGQLPVAGDQCEFVGPHARFNFEVMQIIGRRIAQVRVKKLTQAVDHTVQ